MGFSPFDYLDYMFSFIPVIIAIGFIVIFGIIIVAAIKGIAQWNKNNNSPVRTVDVKIVAKRMVVGYHSHHHGDDTAMHHSSSSTTCYITFEDESGNRMEFNVPSKEYGLLVEGDIGRLTFQGTRYKAFERNIDRSV